MATGIEMGVGEWLVVTATMMTNGRPVRKVSSPKWSVSDPSVLSLFDQVLKDMPGPPSREPACTIIGRAPGVSVLRLTLTSGASDAMEVTVKAGYPDVVTIALAPIAPTP